MRILHTFVALWTDGYRPSAADEGIDCGVVGVIDARAQFVGVCVWSPKDLTRAIKTSSFLVNLYT